MVRSTGNRLLAMISIEETESEDVLCCPWPCFAAILSVMILSARACEYCVRFRASAEQIQCFAEVREPRDQKFWSLRRAEGELGPSIHHHLQLSSLWFDQSIHQPYNHQIFAMPACSRMNFTVVYRRSYSSGTRFRPIDVFGSISSSGHFDPLKPALFKQQFLDIPAIKKWFIPSEDGSSFDTLNMQYMQSFQETSVRLECISTDKVADRRFGVIEASLGALFQNIMSMAGDENSIRIRAYLAQHALEDLPPEIQADVPTPPFINRVGRGDIYGSSLWMGKPPTQTPLHRDPNPNIFVQLAGKKVVRLMTPDQGAKLYHRAKGNTGSATMRGEEMMVGEERSKLEHAVWGDKEEYDDVQGLEAELRSGDGLYIPLGWWHAVNGVGEGVNASVSISTLKRWNRYADLNIV